jgi:hypothetical protein
MKKLSVFIFVLYFNNTVFSQIYFGGNILTVIRANEDYEKYDQYNIGLTFETRFPNWKYPKEGEYYISSELRKTGFIDGFRLNICTGYEAAMANEDLYMRIGIGGYKNWDPAYNGYGFLGEIGLRVDFYNNRGSFMIINRVVGGPRKNIEWLRQNIIVFGIKANLSKLWTGIERRE